MDDWDFIDDAFDGLHEFFDDLDTVFTEGAIILDSVAAAFDGGKKKAKTTKPPAPFPKPATSQCPFCGQVPVLEYDAQDPEGWGPAIPQMQYAYGCGTRFNASEVKYKKPLSGFEQGAGCRALIALTKIMKRARSGDPG